MGPAGSHCARVRRKCVEAWWMLQNQPYRISFEDQVQAASRELSIYHFMGRPWLYRG